MQAHTTHAVDFIYHTVSILSMYKTGGKGCDGIFLIFEKCISPMDVPLLHAIYNPMSSFCVHGF